MVQPVVPALPSVPEEQPEEPFESHCVIELSTKCHEELVNWLIQRIMAPKSVGGAELVVRPVQDVVTNQYRYLHICAPFYRLMEIAEWLEMAKPDLSDHRVLKDFTVKTLPKFVTDVKNPEKLFTYAEKARMVHFEISEVRARSDELDLFWNKNSLRFTVGQSIFTKIRRKDLINNTYSLHNKDELKRLEHEWISTSLFTTQPLDDIRKYFGEHITIYFAFLEFYTEMLVPATLLGIFMFLANFFNLTSLQGVGAFAAFNVLWATFFFERWKRHCATLAHRWGTLQRPNEQLELPRPQFRGQMGKNPVTGFPEPVYSEVNRNLWITFVSTPTVVLCLFTSAYILNKFMREQKEISASTEQMIGHSSLSFLWAYIPSAVYTVWTKCFSLIYSYTASWLTDQENHRLQSQYEFHLIWKLLLFNFVNSFSSLFYIAFWVQDLELLRTHLAAQLITNQLIEQFPETIIPWIKVRFSMWRLGKCLHQQARTLEAHGGYDDPNFMVLREQAIIEGQMPEYSGTFGDYVELFLQFGHCFLFSSAFPVAPLFALVNNLIEIKGDGFKVCSVMRRPFARPANGIGPWQVAFELMGFAAVVTNLALIFVAPETKSSFPATWSSGELILAFVVVEHFLVLAKLGLSSVIPHVPKDIEIQIARNEYEMKLAVREERARESRKEIEQRKMSRRVTGWSPTVQQGQTRHSTLPTGNVIQIKGNGTDRNEKKVPRTVV